MHEAPGTVALTITLVIGSDPVRGSVRLQDDEENHEFWGWLELAEVIQRVAEDGRRGADVSWGSGTTTGAASGR